AAPAFTKGSDERRVLGPLDRSDPDLDPLQVDDGRPERRAAEWRLVPSAAGVGVQREKRFAGRRQAGIDLGRVPVSTCGVVLATGVLVSGVLVLVLRHRSSC